MQKYETEIANWQKTLQNNLPVAFTAYDSDAGQTDRVVAYVMEQADLQALANSGAHYIRVHLGIQDGANFSQIPSNPYAEFFVEGLDQNKKSLVAVKLNWEKNPPLLEPGPNDTDSGLDEIPSDGAILFVMGWLETAYADIATAFEGLNTATNQVQRVRYYTFSEDESETMMNLLKNNSANSSFYLYLGKTIAVTAHPMEFRPVVDIKIDGTNTMGGNGGGGGSHFFDFANPCPPAC